MPQAQMQSVIEDVARAAMPLFALPSTAGLRFVTFRENHVYRVDADERSYALRLHRPGYRRDAQLADEALTLERLAAAGLPVPIPVRTGSGEHVAVLEDADGVRRQITVLTWLEHRRTFGDSGAVCEGRATPDHADLVALGALIGRIHTILAASGPAAGYTRDAWDAEGLSGATALWGQAHSLSDCTPAQRADLVAADRRVGEVLRGLSRDADVYGVIHADMTFENVLVTDDGLVALDFDDSGTGWYAFDLVTPAFWCGLHPDADRLVGALVEGYLTQRAHLGVDARGWEALVMARALSYLGWAAKRPADPTAAFHRDVLLPPIARAARLFAQTGRTGWPTPSVLTAPGK